MFLRKKAVMILLFGHHEYIYFDKKLFDEFYKSKKRIRREVKDFFVMFF